MTSEKESNLLIDGPAGVLEVSINVGQSDAKFADRGYWAVICHPHPSHGGTKENKVVTTLMRTYRDLGISVMRFNFRGVGQSAGEFDYGKGELQDLLAALSWLSERQAPKFVCLAGFSFGSSIVAQASFNDLLQIPFIHMVLVAPPIERYAYDREHRFSMSVCVVQGGQDERVDAEGVYTWIRQLQSATQLICYPEATHFFHGYLSALKIDLTQLLEQVLPINNEVELK